RLEPRARQRAGGASRYRRRRRALGSPAADRRGSSTCGSGRSRSAPQTSCAEATCRSARAQPAAQLGEPQPYWGRGSALKVQRRVEFSEDVLLEVGERIAIGKWMDRGL